MYNHIPAELKKLKQWVCFDVRDGKKLPYTPGTPHSAASNRPTTWRTFEEACADVKEGKRDHIGFTLAAHDPYVFIDLDEVSDLTKSIFERVPGYAQRSVSGTGAHIICRGDFEGAGRHPKNPPIGLFKEDRFCLMTGDVVAGRGELRTADNDDLQKLHAYLGGPNGSSHNGTTVDLVETVSDIPDMTIFEMGCDRFTKFFDLTNGDWAKYDEYGSDHSAADHALISMLCDLTDSNEQVRDLFKMSGMWTAEREAKKAAHGPNGYIDRTIKKTRTAQHHDAARLKKAEAFTVAEEYDEPSTEDVVEDEHEPVNGVDCGASDLIQSLPDGLIKDIARYSFETAFHPLQEASLCVAFMFFAGIVGRGYLTPTNAGLNLWMVLVGGTSCGKDEYQGGLKRLRAAVAREKPAIHNIFGGEIVSGPGIDDALTNTKRFVAYYHEFGVTFARLCSPNAQDHLKTLRAGLLNVFNSANAGQSLSSRHKGSNQGERKTFVRPSVCVSGEATPEELYGAMSTRELSSGLLQRFVILNVPSESWSIEENSDAGGEPDRALVAKLERLAGKMDERDVKDTYHKVGASSKAAALLKDYRRGMRLKIMRLPEGAIEKESLNRSGLKATRIATLLAVSENPDNPLIKEKHAQWAINFVNRTDSELLARFSKGDVGSGQVKQENVVRKALEAYRKSTKAYRKGLKLPAPLITKPSFILMSTLKAAVVNNPAFADDRAGAVSSFEKCVASLVNAGVISKVNATDALDIYGVQHGVLLTINSL